MRRVSSMLGSITCTVRKRRASASSSWMYSLYSLSVVAPIMRTSPRASTDLKTLAASDGAPSADPALADQHHRVRPLAVAEDLEHLLDFLVAAVDRRDLVLARQQIQVRREV